MFLVLTAALFVAVAVGTHNSIFQQRYNDSVQNFVEFLRGIYSQVSNVENQGQGRSDKAIYGKLITFGEKYDLAEERIDDRNAIFTYDIIGNVGDIGTGDIKKALSDLEANIVFYDEKNNNYYSSGMAASYTPKWGATIEKTSGFSDFTGSIMIVRHPRSGTVFTYILENRAIPVNQTKYWYNVGINTGTEDGSGFSDNPLKANLKDFEMLDIDFCINPTPGEANRSRQNVRLVKGARNASGVILVTSDSEDYRCSS